MKCQRSKIRMPSRHSQQGIATILIVVLVGVALTASALGLIHSIRSTQEKQISVHAATNAQNSLWAGVEAFQLYLSGLDDTGLAGLTSSYEIGLPSHYGSVKAENISVTAVGTTKRISAKIISSLSAARASAALGVVYEMEQSNGCSDCVQLPATINFYDDLDVNGAMSFTGATGQGLDINVQGTVDVRNVSLSSIGRLASTESVYLGYGDMDVELVHSNSYVEIESTPGVIGEVQAKGYVTVTGNATVTNIKAEGNVTLNTSGYSNTINTLSNIIAGSSGNHGTGTAGGTINWGAGSVIALNAVGDITLNTSKSVGDVIGEGNINCPQVGTSGSIKVNGTASPNCGASALDSDDNINESVTLMSPISPISMNPFVIDVYKLQGHANYVFRHDGTRTLVRVQNVNGIADGEYMLNSEFDNNGYLCQVPTTGSTCTSLVTPAIRMCMHLKNGECIQYQSGEWKFVGSATIPGIMWFDGNVKMVNGTNYTTILATGNIAVKDGGTNIYSANYAGFNNVCQSTTTGFQDRYPTNLCDFTETTLFEVAAGNIALAAGGYVPPSTTDYQGGKIDLAGTGTIYGSVLAGTRLKTLHGDVEVHGYIVAADMDDFNTETNQLNGSTVIDLSSLPDTYDPSEIPDMSENGGGGGGGHTDGVKVLWTKYL